MVAVYWAGGLLLLAAGALGLTRGRTVDIDTTVTAGWPRRAGDLRPSGFGPDQDVFEELFGDEADLVPEDETSGLMKNVSGSPRTP
ncbi:MAG: hypothetical protein ACLGHT_10225 [Acidimicrobiia bacterium]